MTPKQEAELANVMHNLKVREELKRRDEEYADALRAKFGKKATDAKD